jgi:hypothetical protein
MSLREGDFTPVHGEFKITRRLECGTTLDNAFASDTSRGLLVIQFRRPWVLAGVLHPRVGPVAIEVILKID